VGGLQKLDIGSPRCQNLGGMRMNDHPWFNRGVTSANQRSQTFYFHNTNTADSCGMQIWAVTESGDLNSDLLSGL
jgi:hypothetical protein